MINYLIKAALLEKSVYSIFKKSPEMVLYSLVTVSLTGLSLAAALKYTTDNTGTESYLMIMVAFSTIMVDGILLNIFKLQKKMLMTILLDFLILEFTKINTLKKMVNGFLN